MLVISFCSPSLRLSLSFFTLASAYICFHKLMIIECGQISLSVTPLVCLGNPVASLVISWFYFQNSKNYNFGKHKAPSFLWETRKKIEPKKTLFGYPPIPSSKIQRVNVFWYLRGPITSRTFRSGGDLANGIKETQGKARCGKFIWVYRE